MVVLLLLDRHGNNLSIKSLSRILCTLCPYQRFGSSYRPCFSDFYHFPADDNEVKTPPRVKMEDGFFGYLEWKKDLGRSRGKISGT